MLRIKPQRIADALLELSRWRQAVQSQAAMHLLPLLALLEAGAGKTDETGSFLEVTFNERPNEYDFWRKYFSLSGNVERPFFNPLTLRLAEANYPHSNSATIRKKTFRHSWSAATLSIKAEDGSEVWKLAVDYAAIFEAKVLSKGGEATRIPILDLSVVLFREETFPDDASCNTLIELFRERFPQNDADYNRLFEFKNEPSAQLFAPESGNEARDYEDQIKSTLIGDDTIPAKSPLVSPLEQDDAILAQVIRLLKFGSSGIILEGPPGTGKSWYAKRIAEALVKNVEKDIFHAQFHPSFGYEDFVEGYRPDETTASGYAIIDKLFLKVCKRALETSPYPSVIIIDEITRGDPARIFGELLTYIERGYRGSHFLLPFTGNTATIPENLVILGTMNPYDHSVSHVDAAFVRRFDFVQIPPSAEAVEAFLQGGSLSDSQISKIRNWFESCQELLSPLGIGHTFFKDVRSINDLELVWDYRIKRYGESVLEFDPVKRKGFIESFSALLGRIRGDNGPWVL